MKGKSYTAGTPEASEAVFENCFFIDSKGRANSRTEYRVQNVIVTPGKECFILYNPETGKTRHAKRIFIPSNVIEPGAILYSHPHRDLVRVDGIEEQTEPGEALIRVYHRGFLYLVSLSDLYSDSSERHPAKLDTTPAPDTTPADVIPETTPAPVTAAETTPAPDVSQESNTESAPETSPTLYKYGMRSRGYSIAAQPAGVVAREDDPTGIYYDIICYERELTPAEVDHYSLDPLQPAGEPVQAASQDTTSPAIISDKETTTAAATEPETVTESTNSQPEKAATAQATRPREGPTRPARIASHTDTHERHKTRYKAKYKAARTREGPPKQSLFSKVS